MLNDKRFIKVTQGNVEHNHIYITGHHDFFPKDCLGGPNGRSTPGRPVFLELVGLSKKVATDIPTDARTRKPRRHFRARSWAHEFFDRHRIVAGDVLCLERIGTRDYRLSVARRSGDSGAATFLEFFAGIGLMRLGLEGEGWRVLYANDIDPLKQEMYAAHFSDSARHFHLADIHRVDASEIPYATLATASFPCTDLSLAGGKKGLNGKQSSAFFGFLRVLRDMGDLRPPLVLLENVPAFLTSHGGLDFRQAMQGLNDLGYAVDPFLLDAKWFVPQSRPRLFVAGIHESIPAESACPVLLSTSRMRPPILTDFMARHSDIRWTIRPLPNPPSRAEQSLVDILEALPNDAQEWWDSRRSEYLYNQMSPRHRVIADAWIRQRKWSVGTVFRRVRSQPDGQKRSMAELRSDGIAGCLRTPKGGSGRQIIFKAGYGKYYARLLTPRECARLMGADDFVIEAPLNQALFGFGDAVCVPAIQWIARHYLTPVASALTQEWTCG